MNGIKTKLLIYVIICIYIGAKQSVFSTLRQIFAIATLSPRRCKSVWRSLRYYIIKMVDQFLA